MAEFNDIDQLSPLPIVNLHDIGPPRNGLLIRTPSSCLKNFRGGEACRQHYVGLSTNPDSKTLVQCPFGFCSRIIRTKGLLAALTGIIPFPRIGGDAERRMAKKHPDVKMSVEAIDTAANAIAHAVAHFEGIEQESVNKHSMALHEIRKLNRTVKQTAERLCVGENPDSPDLADPQLVQIWKSSELMSRQFDVIEILANESLIHLPLNVVSEVYRIFDKCVRIYNPPNEPPRLSLRASYGYSGKVLACDKTFSIIPSVLIENALKYSIAGTPINIDVSSNRGKCIVRVSNRATNNPGLNDAIFNKGVRRSADKDGSGNGLYLAKLVAAQHGGDITLTVRTASADVLDCAFTVTLPESIE